MQFTYSFILLKVIKQKGMELINIWWICIGIAFLLIMLMLKCTVEICEMGFLGLGSGVCWEKPFKMDG